MVLCNYLFISELFIIIKIQKFAYFKTWWGRRNRSLRCLKGNKTFESKENWKQRNRDIPPHPTVVLKLMQWENFHIKRRQTHPIPSSQTKHITIRWRGAGYHTIEPADALVGLFDRENSSNIHSDITDTIINHKLTPLYKHNVCFIVISVVIVSKKFLMSFQTASKSWPSNSSISKILKNFYWTHVLWKWLVSYVCPLDIGFIICMLPMLAIIGIFFSVFGKIAPVHSRYQNYLHESHQISVSLREQHFRVVSAKSTEYS